MRYRKTSRMDVPMLLVALLACSTPIPTTIPEAAPPGVHDLRTADPPKHYRDGFVQMHPVVHLPSNASDPQVEVWVRLPDKGTITETDTGLLTWPPGTIADRVEWRGTGDKRHVVDVRGGSIAADGTSMHRLFRPTGPAPSDDLLGVAWAATDTTARKAAVERLIAGLLPTEMVQGWSEKKRESWSGGLRRKSNCTRCHVVARPVNTIANEHGLTNRGTDAVGWFTPASVFEDSLPIESYGSVDFNTSPHLTVRCGDAPAKRVEDAWTCPENRVPVGHFDLSAALASSDPHALRVCESRRWLWERMDDKARDKRASAVQICPSSTKSR